MQLDPQPKKGISPFELFALAVATLSAVPAWLRDLRGHRCDPVWMRAVGLWLVPVLWAAGGGGRYALVQFGWWALVVGLIVLHFRSKRAAQDGRLTNTRFIGLPWAARLFPGSLTQGAAHFLEVVMWLALAVAATAAGEPGWAFVFTVWAGTLPWELVFLNRRDQTMVFDTQDSMAMQHQHAERVRGRIGSD